MAKSVVATKPTTTILPDPELGEQTPLIPGNARGDEKPLAEIEDWTRREKAVAGVSAISFATSAAGMMLVPDPVVLVSGTIGCVVAPYVAIQQQKITHVQALAETNRRVQEEVEELKGENDKLQSQVQDLTETVENLKVQKEKLDTISSVQGASVDELERQLGETRKIYEKMQDNLQGDILNNLIDIALVCDQDGNDVMSDAEIDLAISKLERINGIEVDNEGVRKALIQKGRSVDAIMSVIRNLLDDDIPLEENLFRISQSL